MDQNGNNIPESNTPTPFSFLRLLCGDDWHLWDPYPTVDVSPNLPVPTVEMNHDGLTIEPDPLLMTLTREQTVEQWLQSLTNEGFEMPSQEEHIQEVEEMPTDEDNFTYEELLELGEQIGYVCTGLNDEIIDENLSRRKYEDRSGQTEKCVICLYEFKHNDDASKLACGHDFHFGCIKKWLVVKNKCPLCKQKAL